MFNMYNIYLRLLSLGLLQLFLQSLQLFHWQWRACWLLGHKEGLFEVFTVEWALFPLTLYAMLPQNTQWCWHGGVCLLYVRCCPFESMWGPGAFTHTYRQFHSIFLGVLWDISINYTWSVKSIQIHMIPFNKMSQCTQKIIQGCVTISFSAHTDVNTD